MSDTQYFDPKNYDKEAIVATDAAKEHIKKTIEKHCLVFFKLLGL